MENVKSTIKGLLKENGYKCNADGRRFIADKVGALEPRKLDETKWLPVLEYAEQIGGCRPGEKYIYANAQGFLSTARVTSLYNLPEDMVNPVLVCFSGMMTAHLCAFEIIRFYAKQHDELLPLLAIGKSGNKGLYKTVFNREQGIMVDSEYNAYLNALEHLAPSKYVRANERVCKDMDTAGNFDELYQFAKETGHSEVTYILCSGNFSYDKRLLAEFLLKASAPEFKDVKINFVLAHCPIITNLKVVDGHLSETMLGYIAACLGPLMKNTVTFDGSSSSENPERYLMPGVAEADWSVFKELICKFSNMGWPNYAELLYGTPHEEAVLDIILSDLHARGSFTKDSYDEGLAEDLEAYQQFVGKYEGGENLAHFIDYLQSTPEKYFPWNSKVSLFNQLYDAYQMHTSMDRGDRIMASYQLDEIRVQTNGKCQTWPDVQKELTTLGKSFGK